MLPPPGNWQGGIHVQIIEEGNGQLLSRKDFHHHGKGHDRKASQEGRKAKTVGPSSDPEKARTALQDKWKGERQGEPAESHA